MVEIVVVLCAVIVGTISVARLTRLVTQDSFPPSAWVRSKWDELTDDGPWSTLTTIPASNDGLGEFLDSEPPQPMGFYRLFGP